MALHMIYPNLGLHTLALKSKWKHASNIAQMHLRQGVLGDARLNILLGTSMALFLRDPELLNANPLRGRRRRLNTPKPDPGLGNLGISENRRFGRFFY